MLICKSTRDFLVSFVACFWNRQLSKMMEIYPGVIFLLATRYYQILLVGLASWLSAGRMLLLTNPVFFHQLQPNKGAMVVAVLTVCVGVMDIIYTLIACGCGINLNRTRMFYHLKMETGIHEIRMSDNFNSSQNLTKEGVETQKFCYPLPVIQLLILLTVLMELTYFTFLVVKEHKKNKKAAKISPSLQIPLSALPLHVSHERLTSPTPKELGGGQHFSQFLKVQNNDVEAMRIKDTRRVPRGNQRSRSLPRFHENFDKIKTEVKHQTENSQMKSVSPCNTRIQRSMTLTELQYQDCRTAREAQEDLTNSTQVEPNRSSTRNAGSKLLIRVQVHDAPRVRRSQEDQTSSSSRLNNENLTEALSQIHNSADDSIEVDHVQHISAAQTTFSLALDRDFTKTQTKKKEGHKPSQSSCSNGTEFTTLVRNNLKQHFMKTSSFISMLLVIGLVYSFSMYVFPSFTSVSLMMFFTRLSTFVIIILIASFDKDIIECFEQKVLVHFSK